MNGPLLGKSKPKGGGEASPAITLVGHTLCVLAAVDALFVNGTNPSRLGRSWLRFFGLDESNFERFRRNLRVAAAAHDWGKANDGFQDAVAKRGDQTIRHEHLSAMLLQGLFEEPGRKAYWADSGIDQAVVLAAVVSHHVKAARESPGGSDAKHLVGSYVGTNDSLRFCSDHPDFAEVWGIIQAEVGSTCPTSIDAPARWNSKAIELNGERLRDRLDQDGRRLRDDPKRRRWVAAVRSGLIAADAVGSAVVRFDQGVDKRPERAIQRWVGACFTETLSGKEIWEKVTLPRIEELRRKGRWTDAGDHEVDGVRGFTRFQCEVADRGPRVLLTAACGSGKTLAAWNWIKARADARAPDDGPIARVLFLYPTRATATEGFRDYVSWAPEDDAGLLSGTADYELQDMFADPVDPEDRRKGLDYRLDPRLFALGSWSKRIFSATADQFFPFMQYAYGPLCLLPLLAESIIVVDEVHSFDESMFNTLRRFLKEFPKVPVLAMTATLSDHRKSDLAGCGLVACVGDDPPGDDGLADADRDRYQIRWIDREEARWLAKGALADDKRVLWVSNRVDDCQDVFRSVSRAFPEDDYAPAGSGLAHCYHSRFKLEDRKKRHQALIGAFQDAVREGAEARAVFGATTQVCEMSLDLDAEILITELAPIAALIQRMGRCNRDSRRLKGPTPPIGRVYVLRPEPGKEKPYEKDELDLAGRFVDKVAGPPVTQADLDRAYRDFDPGKVEPSRLCPFLDSGPYAVGGEESFREIDEFTVACVLDSDLNAILSMLKGSHRDGKSAIDGLVVPVPRRFATEPRPDKPYFPRWLSVASQAGYEPSDGFDGRKLLQAEGHQS